MARRAIYDCECSWNHCTVRTYKEPRYCLCEWNSKAVQWICKTRSKGQQKLEVE